ncbi:nucleoside kinase [Hominiventricola filiformis]|uniref:Nucleoside kinase n=1 Tax=Hominiventricola filiformis TaxID=2885352 RepID=A0AAE3DAI4_9FIRM|nr:nucleoside kinase [Hominiventricola filiformis]MCC2124596.1 nucleoside kinase [Hominiventricola filiformis]
MRQITVEGQTLNIKDGTTYLELAKNFQKKYDHDIVLVLENNKMRELFRKVKDGAAVTFLTTGQIDGYNTYRRSATLLLLKAIYDVEGMDAVRGMKVEFSAGEGYYVSSRKMPVNEETLARIENRMKELVSQNLPIEKRSIPVEEAIEHFTRHGMTDKARLFRFRRSSSVNVYLLDGFEDYYYGYMVPSTGYLKYFKLIPYDEGFVLEFPPRKTPETFGPFREQPKVFQTLKNSTKWGEILNVGTVGALNEQISEGNVGNIILAQEAIMEKGLGDIAAEIASRPDKKLIMIAGPSSSGKTTFSHRLSIQLMAHGLKPHPIAVDNYFVERVDTPKDENGQYNFECLEAMDIELFNQQMSALLRGEKVFMPTFNFVTGMKEYKGNSLKLGPEDVLVIEGIHCLNDALSYSLPAENKFKIYVSALTQMNIDEHNRIPTTDGRLIRRMVRDARTRGASAQKTISMWPSVRRGEDENIFPYQESADVVFNSALIYELAVLKQYAEPLLFGIRPEDPEYLEAKRLLKFLNYFQGIDSNLIPGNSILREFIGGSFFPV